MIERLKQLLELEPDASEAEILAAVAVLKSQRDPDPRERRIVQLMHAASMSRVNAIEALRHQEQADKEAALAAERATAEELEGFRRALERERRRAAFAKANPHLVFHRPDAGAVGVGEEPAKA